MVMKSLVSLCVDKLYSTHIDSSNPLYLPDDVLQKIIEREPKFVNMNVQFDILTTIDLSRSNCAPEELCSFLSKAQNLKSVNLSRTEANDVVVRSVSRSVQSLVLEYIDLTPQGFSLIADEFSSLTKLSLSLKKKHNTFSDLLANKTPFSSKHLSCLYLCAIPTKQDTIKFYFGSVAFGGLKELALLYMDSVTDAAFQTLLESHSTMKLEALSLDGSVKVTGNSLVSLANHVSSKSILYFSCNTLLRIRDPSMDKLLTEARNIVQIQLPSHLSSKCYLSVLEALHKNLEKFVCCFSKTLDEFSFPKIEENALGCLNTLSIMGCPKIGPEAVQRIAFNCGPSLRVLNMSRCEKVCLGNSFFPNLTLNLKG